MLSNTLALDVVIGLILIYFIYSLLISIIGEMLSSWMGIRARLLRQGIGSLLNDHRPANLGKDLFRWLKDVFLVEPADFKYSSAGRFYKEPAIRKMAKRGDEKAWYSFKNTRPSYLSKELYASTIITMFGRKGHGVCERDRVFMGVETNTARFEPETYKRFKELLDASNGELRLFRVHLEEEFSEMMDRVTGWYKRKLGFVLFWVGFLICATLNVDTFQIVNALVKNPSAREGMVKLAQEAVKDKNEGKAWVHVSPDSSTYLALLDESYSKAFRDAREVEFLLATGWNFEGKSTEVKVAKDRISDVRRILQRSKSFQINKIRGEIDASDYNAPQLKEKIADYYQLVHYEQTKVLNHLAAIVGKRVSSIDSLFLTKENKLKATIEPSFGIKVWSVICHALPWKIKFWGLVLSALALSLGSNFWFDLLKRLVAIRSAGVKPEERAQNQGENIASLKQATSDGLFVDKPDPVMKGISDYRQLWENIKGVIAVNEALVRKPDESLIEGIEVVIDPNNFFSNQIPDVLYVDIGSGETPIIINKTIGSVGILTHGGSFVEGNIYHPATNQKGSPAGIVHNSRTGRNAILTCSHIVQNDNDPFMDPFELDTQLIVDLSGTLTRQTFGRVRNLNLSSYMDAAIIDIEKPDVIKLLKSGIFKLANIKSPKDVSETDVQNGLKLVIHTPRQKIENLVLNNSSVSYTFNGDTKVEARFRNLIRFGDKASQYTKLPTISGDSGSLITNEAGDPVAILLGHAQINQEYHIFGIKMKDVFEIMQIQTVKIKA